MPIPLTTQEKKVLGFILLMIFLGLAVMAAKKWLPGWQKAPAPAAAAVQGH